MKRAIVKGDWLFIISVLLSSCYDKVSTANVLCKEHNQVKAVTHTETDNEGDTTYDWPIDWYNFNEPWSWFEDTERLAGRYRYWDIDRNSLDMAVFWCEMGCFCDNVRCMIYLADICLSADSTHAPYHNVSKGIKILEKASRLGSSIACRRLGEEYFKGDLIEQNYKMALYYLRKALEYDKLDDSFGNGDLMEIYSIIWIITSRI